MKSIIKIGPYFEVHNQPDYIPNMTDAYQADNERGGHHLDNAASERLNQEWPTVIEMARLIETERDTYRMLLTRIKQDIEKVENGMKL